MTITLPVAPAIRSVSVLPKALRKAALTCNSQVALRLWLALSRETVKFVDKVVPIAVPLNVAMVGSLVLAGETRQGFIDALPVLETPTSRNTTSLLAVTSCFLTVTLTTAVSLDSVAGGGVIGSSRT